jgi:hypothetical protein
MRKLWVAAGLAVLVGAGAGGNLGGSSGQQAPSSTTVDPTTAPDGGEPGIVPGPPNPGYCKPPDGTAPQGVVRAVPPSTSVVPPCR